jgi:hypothetical protein
VRGGEELGGGLLYVVRGVEEPRQGGGAGATAAAAINGWGARCVAVSGRGRARGGLRRRD